MRPTWRAAVLAVVCLAELAVPAAMMRRAQLTLEEGRRFRFLTRPVDPADPVRGRYIALAFEATSGPALGDEPLLPGGRAYALLGEDEEGFAFILGVARRPPEDPSYLAVNVGAVTGERVEFRFPLDRFYLEESKAPRAERVTNLGGRRIWADVRVRRGHAVIADVLVEGVPIGEFVGRPGG